jgi:hypothetical protein
MSVEKTGPKGYEVQYLLTLWLGLLHEIAEPGQSTLQVEGLEDAELILRVDSEELQLSMQSKYQEGDLDASVLAEWLAHFGPRQATECLIHRLQNNPKLVALLITKRRCADNAKGFIRPLGEFNPHKQLPMTKDDLALVCKGLTGIFRSKGTVLEQARAAICQKLAEILEHAGLKEMWKRIVIWDQITEEEVEHRILRSLARFRIPSTVRPAVVGLLLEEIRNGRDLGTDVMPAIRNVLNQYDVQRMLSARLHLVRPEEKDLTETLELNKTLCLTGRPQSGKSHLACAIAQSMQDRGIDCLRTEDLQDAIKFLDRYALETRLVVLDDPLTFAHDRAKMRYRISQLVRELPIQHRLIVTARREELTELMDASGGIVKDIYGLDWHDVTMNGRDFSRGLWQRLKHAHAVDERLSRVIEEHLQTTPDNELLQPGQLDHVARNPPPSNEWGADAVLSYARFNAPMIADLLSIEVETRMLQLVLGMCATGFRGMSEMEIQFALQTDLNGAGMHTDSLGRMISLGAANDDQDPDREFPRYEGTLQLPLNYKDQLRSFEKRGYLRFINSQWMFSHPDYREAFQRRILLEPPSGVEDYIALFHRAFESLDSDVGQSACRFLSLFLSQGHSFNARVKSQLLKHATEAAKKSIFPNVRSSLLLILLTESKTAISEDLLYLVKHAQDDMQSSILWRDDVPWVHNSSKGWFTDYSRAARKLSPENLKIVLDSFESNQPPQNLPNKTADAINTEFMWGDGDYAPNLALILALLRSNQVFIRADAAQVSLQYHLITERKVRETLFSDDHPIVRARIVNHMFKAWPELKGVKVLAELCADGCRALENPAVAVICCHTYVSLASKIEIESARWSDLDKEDWQKLWSYWAKAVATILRTLGSTRFYINTAEFYATVEYSAPYLKKSDFFDMAMGWIDWIAAQLKHSYVDDWGLAVVDCCFASTSLLNDQRFRLVQRMLDFDSTDACGMAVRDLVDHWPELSCPEKNALHQCLNSSRPDVHWLKSIALTRDEVPWELTHTLAGCDGFFSLHANERAKALSPIMLEACMALTMGHVGYNSAFSVARGQQALWDDVLYSSLLTMSDPMSRAAVSHLTERIAYHGYRPDLALLWESSCNAADANARALIFESLLACSLSWVNPRLGEAWSHFLKLEMNDKERGHYADQLVTFVEGLEYKSGQLEGLQKTLGKTFVWTELLVRLRSDLIAWQIFKLLSGPGNPAYKAFLIEKLNTIYIESPPRLVSFHDYFSEQLDKLGIDGVDDLRRHIKKARSSWIETAVQQCDEHRCFRFPLVCWVAPHLAFVETSNDIC